MQAQHQAIIQNKRSLMRAALISPLVVPFAFSLIYSTTVTFIEGASIEGFLGMFGIFLFFGLLLTYCVTFVLVLPMAIFLKKKNALSAVPLCLWCTLIGPVALYMYMSLLGGSLESTPDATKLVLPMLFGLVSGASFCAIAGIGLYRRSPGLKS